MGLLSSFKRKAADSRAAADEPAGDAVQVARTRARRRLIGAVVLLLIGIIGFPIVFETQPRPIPLDIPIEIPPKDAVRPLVMPAPRPAAANDDIITEPAGANGHTARAIAGHPASDEPLKQPAAAQKPTAAAETEKPVAAAESKVREVKLGAFPSEAAQLAVNPSKRPIESVKQAPAAGKVAEATKVTDHAKAPEAVKPLEVIKPTNSHAASDSGRFVVQVGAFADPGAAREVRQRVEKLGLKTYTQVAQTAAGNRIRVRVGPFATRDEADRALAKARGAGLSAVVLTL